MGLTIRTSGRTRPDGKPLGLLSRLFGTLFFGVFLAMGLFFLVMLSRECWRMLAPRLWVEETATILSSSVAKDGPSQKPYRFVTRYRYTYGGEEYTGDRWRISGGDFDQISKARDLSGRYPVGARVPCYVNPDSPGEAVLEQQIPWMGLFLILPLVFVFIGGGGIYGVWRADSAPEQKPISGEAENQDNGGCFLAILSGIFLLVGLLAGTSIFVLPATRIVAARSWIEVPCVVESSRVVTHSDEDGNTYSVDILYRYTYEGRDYESSRYEFAVGSSSGYDGKRAIVSRYRAGTRATCWVDPDHPGSAVLQRGWTANMLFNLIPLLLAPIGAIGVVIGLRLRRRRRLTSATGVSYVGDGVGRSGAETGRRVAGGVELKVKTSPLGKLIGVTLVALFWNGIVGVFVYNIVHGWATGDGSVLLTLFMTPFVLIGLGLIFGIVYFALALANPRPRLVIDSDRLELGGTTSLEWTIQGNARRIRKLEILLEGRESATYRRGTTTTTDHSLFYREIAFLAEDSREFTPGRAELRIPERTMHTFKASNNRIEWQLRVHGDIERWPDVDDAYAIVVEPAGALKGDRL